MTPTEVWPAVGAIATIAAVGVAVVSGFFGWLSKKLDAIGAHLSKQDEHLAKQDAAIAEVKTDISWLKRQIKSAPRTEEEGDDV